MLTYIQCFLFNIVNEIPNTFLEAEGHTIKSFWIYTWALGAKPKTESPSKRHAPCSIMWQTFALGAMQNAQSLWCLGAHFITDKPSFKDKGRSTFA